MKTKKKLPQVQYNKPIYNIQLTEDEMYNFGGWLKENAGSLLSTVAGTAMSFVPGLQGVGIPMAVSGAAGLLGSANADKTDEDLERRNAEAAYQTQMNMPNTVGTKNMTPNVMHFKKGGKIEKVMSEFKHGKLHSGSKKGPKVKSRKQALAIAISEAKKAGQYKAEMGGDLMEIEGPSHEQGGVQLQQGVEVEGGETIKNNVVNSDSWIITPNIADNYSISKKAVGKTPAQYSKSVKDNYDKKINVMGAKKDFEFEQGKISLMSDELSKILGNKSGKAQNGKRIPYPKSKVSTPENPLFYNYNSSEWPFLLEDPLNRSSIGYKKQGYGSSFNPVESFMEGERNWVANMGNNLAQKPLTTQSVSNKSAVVPRVSTLNAGTEPLVKMGVTEAIGKTRSNIDWGNIGQTALGLAPMAVQAFMNARNKVEGYDKVKLPRLHAEEMNPELIDPSYQVQQAQDAFATGNEQMSQISRKDFLRRRIQSATEEGKTTSGIRGQVAATNTQLLNQAKEINLQNKMRTGMANIETQLQEENINAANKGAYQTARDYGLSNLGTMAGEYARDLRLEDAQNLFNENTLTAMNASTGITGYQWEKDDTGHLKYVKVGNAQAPVLNPISAVERNTPHTFNSMNDYKGAPDLESGYGNYNFPGWNKKITGKTYSYGRYRG